MQSPRENSRRDFLQGKAAADALYDLTAGPDTSAEAAPNSGHLAPSGIRGSVAGAGGSAPNAGIQGPFLMHLGRAAMACQFELYFNGGQYPHSTQAGLEALDRIEALEDQLSVYRETSEVAHINRVAAFVPVVVETGLFALLARAVQIHQETSGAFDITASPLSRAWGFFRRAGKVPNDVEVQQARELVGSHHVKLDPERYAVQFQKPGVELSLNSIGKGFSLDRVAELLHDQGIDDFMFHGGQSSVLAAGSNAATPGRGWTIGLRHPLRPDARLAEFYLSDEALATSGTGRQHFHHQGRRYGHILDPRSGLPADGVFSATVIAGNATDADALATAFYVLGPRLAQEYCESHAGVGMLIVTPGEKLGTISVHSYGLREDSWRLCEE